MDIPSAPGDNEAERFWDRLYGEHERREGREPSPLLVETARPLTPGAALDLGCGEGVEAVWLASRGWRVTAVDISAAALEHVVARAAAAGVADRLGTERHDLARTFPEGAYDLVSAHYLHTYFDLPRARVFQQAARALTPGGVLLIVDHGSMLPWAWNPAPDAYFPPPEEIFDEIGLDPARWRPERLDRPKREATGPDGRTAVATDTVIVVRRLPDPS